MASSERCDWKNTPARGRLPPAKACSSILLGSPPMTLSIARIVCGQRLAGRKAFCRDPSRHAPGAPATTVSGPDIGRKRGAFPAARGDKAATKVAYLFFDNPRVNDP